MCGTVEEACRRTNAFAIAVLVRAVARGATHIGEHARLMASDRATENAAALRLPEFATAEAPARHGPIAPGDEVDDAADGRIAIERGCAAANDLYRLDRLERDEVPVDLARRQLGRGHAVDEHHGVVRLATAVKAAHDQSRRLPEAVTLEHEHAGHVLQRFGNVPHGQAPQRLARQVRHRGGGCRERGIDACGGHHHRIEPVRA